MSENIPVHATKYLRRGLPFVIERTNRARGGDKVPYQILLHTPIHYVIPRYPLSIIRIYYT